MRRLRGVAGKRVEMSNSGDHKLSLVGPATEEKIEQLQKVLRSRALQNSESLKALLQYVAGRVIEGQDSHVKEYTIAVDVFGRGKDFDASTDSVVRVQAKRLREKLKEYYETEGKSDDVLIELPKGHYNITFSRVPRQEGVSASNAGTSLREVPEAPAAAPPSFSGDREKAIRLVMSVTLVILAIAVAMLAYSNRSLRKQAPVQSRSIGEPDSSPLWAPFFGSSVPTLLILSNPPIFRFSNAMDPEALLKNAVELAPQQSEWVSRLLSDRVVSKQTGRMKLVLSQRDYTGIGEAIGLYEVAELFRSAGKSVVFKQSRTVSAEDLKGNNVVLLGSVWANVWSGKLPVQEDFNYTVNATIENTNPKGDEQREYRPRFNEQTGELIGDYALVTVRPGVTNNNMVMVLAGIESEGTQAAAEFVTSKDYVATLNQRLRQLSGNGTAPKYYQILLKVDVDNGIPTTVSIVTMHALAVARN